MFRPIPTPSPRTRPCPVSFANNAPNPAPLSARQLWSLTTAAARELTWTLPVVAHEVRRWRILASTIPDAPIREEAQHAITAKRSHIDGAALFSILTRNRNPYLVRLLVAYEIIWDFLDSISERGAEAGIENGFQLHLALIDAVDPGRPLTDYYRYSQWRDDGGYLNKLVNVCRASCAQLPSYELIRQSVVCEAKRGQVCAINHHTDPSIRDAMLKARAVGEYPSGRDAWWFELTAAASTDLTIFALFSLASETTVSRDHVRHTSEAYFPWASALAALLDSYVDQAEDVAKGDHSYVAHYATTDLATHRICAFIQRCLKETGSLNNGEKHRLIVACMFAMYLSKNSALTPAMRETTKVITDSGGSLTRVLHPILRLWRTAYGLRSA